MMTIRKSIAVRASLSLLPCFLILLLTSGCVSVPKRNPVPPELGPEAEIEGIPEAREFGDVQPLEEMKRYFEASKEEVQAEFPAIYGRPHVYLAISGGGANGAFAAGLLNGWTEAGDRPEFTVVTGVSTGALIAPFAFLGSEYDDELKEAYTTITTDDVLKARSLLNTLSSDAAASSEPLQEQIAKQFDETVMQEVAKQHRRGRRLFIGTTHLDAGRAVHWSIGRIADSGHPRSLELIRQVMLASASIPGAFPPVLIEVEAGGESYDELHVDGGVTAQVFLYPLNINWDDVLSRLEVPGRPRVYIIRNSRLDPEWKTVKNKVFAISRRTVGSLIRTQGLGDLYRIYLATQRDGLDFNLARIPSDFRPEKKEQFDPEYMGKLFDLAYEKAKEGYPWDKMPPEIEDAVAAHDLYKGR